MKSPNFLHIKQEFFPNVLELDKDLEFSLEPFFLKLVLLLEVAETLSFQHEIFVDAVRVIRFFISFQGRFSGCFECMIFAVVEAI